MSKILRDEDYRELLLLRTGLRRFIHQSEIWARAAGLTPAQHQLLLAIRGHDRAHGPTISDVAGYLLLRHHSVVELVDRAVDAGFIVRREDAHDARVVRLALTKKGRAALERLSEENLEELRRLADHFRPLWHDLDGETASNPSVPLIRVARIYDTQDEQGATRVLVDRLWPRGISKDDATFDEWYRDIAPSTELRRWYAHEPERFKEFKKRYVTELRDGHAEKVDTLVELAHKTPLVLLTATKDVARSAASVLVGELQGRTSASNEHPKGRPRRATSRLPR